MSTIEREVGESEATTIAESAVAPAARAPRISQDDVFRAADELLLDGHRPTIDRVRMHLGRGSPNTINDHLDAWWAKLGSRLRDLPGREFPQLPERVAQSLQQLWNDALEGAHEALQSALGERDQALRKREGELASRSREITEREERNSARATAIEESLGLAREQLSAANRRAEGLEAALDERDSECTRRRLRVEALEESGAELRGKLDAAAGAHEAERTKLQEQYAGSEARWLFEVDRARQAAKDAAKDHERQLQEIRGQLVQFQSERERLRQELLESRSELKTATAVREQLEERLRSAASPVKRRRAADSARKPLKRRPQSRKVQSPSRG